MDQSILNNTKAILGLTPSYAPFDLAIITHINSAFSTLTQLGIGPVDGFAIESDEEVWEDFMEDNPKFNSVKSYVYLKTRQLFDPPTTSYLISAMEKQIEELEWRLNTTREATEWTDPDPPLMEIEL